jgi:uncharacterized protein involved in outer membrane biogenesis
MGARLTELRGRLTRFAKHPRTRKAVIWFISIVAAIGVIGALIAPPLVRKKLAGDLTKTLHREVSIEQIRINPYALSVAVRGFLVKERQSAAPALSFDELYINLQLSSLFQRGVVLKEIRLVKPYVNLVRNQDFTYNFTDLIEEFTKGPPGGPTPRFSLNNIEVVDGRIDFDDRPEGVKHTVESIRLGVPFVSSIPYYTDVKVQPAFAALVNGAPVEIGGETKPFKDSRESVIHLEIDKLLIPKYLEYSPVELKFKMPSGQLDGELKASFGTSKGKPAVLSISGHLAVKELVLQEKNDSPIFSLPSLDLVIDALEVFASRANLKALKIQGPELHVTRNRDGALNLASLVVVKTQDKASEAKPEAKKESAPFVYHVDEVLLEQGKLHFVDQSLERPFQKRLENIRISIKGLTNEADKKAETEISLQTDGKEQLSHAGTLQLAPLAAKGKIEIAGLQLKGIQPYLQGALRTDLRDGSLDLGSRFTVEKKSENLSAVLSELNLALRSFRLDLPGESEPLWRIAQLAVKDTTIDVAKKSIVIGALEGRDASGFVHREADGAISYARLTKPARAPESPAKTAEKEAAPWTVEAKRVSLERFKTVFEDRSLAKPARVVLSEVSARGENLSTAKNARAKIAFRAKINDKGAIRLAGTASANPVAVRLTVEAQEIELLPFQPYLANQVNFILTGGAVGSKGNFVLEPASDGSSKTSYEGTVQVTDFSSVESTGTEDLLRWKSLDLSPVRFSMQPVQLQIGEITLADFYSRVIIGADGKINLQKLAAQKKDEPEVQSPAADQATQAAAAPEASPTRVTIGKINLQAGNVNFSDFFVKPNYSVNLTQFQGSVSELKPEAPGDLLLQAKIDDAAPVEINGKINPLAKNLFLDIKANARDIELSPLTPYSAKYVGYGIEKGKLSLDVQYRVEDRKLTGQNKIILNQLTFGERIESPTAIKAPVLLAVALLKDRNGVIDINLPISGSLDSPEFSVGGIVVQLVFNVITRAVTAPFTLLAGLFGSGSEELSYVEFDYGRARITPAVEGRLKTLARALNDRPALKLEISGRVDPVNDLDGLKRAALERKVKAQKLKELARSGAGPKSLDDIRIESAEYERFLAAAYGEETFPKPRNLIGLAKGLPVPEMEKLMLQHSQVTEADLRQLAAQRAQAVRDYILATGQAGADRLFIVASSAASEEAKKAQGKASRVDFSLR